MKYSLAIMLAAGAMAGQAGAAAGVIEPAMVNIPAGTFMMGSDRPSPTNGRSEPGEGPVHQVGIQAFRMAKYEVTVAQFRQFVEATGRKIPDQCWKPANNEYGITGGTMLWSDAFVAPSPFHPVACVSWDDATAYASWLSARTGRTYRLPTEAEWEYVATAGGTRAQIAPDTAAFCRYENLGDRRTKAALQRDFGLADNGRGAPCDDGSEYTSVVGMYEPNPFGLHDMGGNVSEWMQDCQHATYEGAPTDGSAWTTACDKSRGGMMLRRGGDLRSTPNGVRFALRMHGGQDNHSFMDGFRLAQDGTADCKKKGACRASAASARFEADLLKAQAAERQKRSALPALAAGK